MFLWQAIVSALALRNGRTETGTRLPEMHQAEAVKSARPLPYPTRDDLIEPLHAEYLTDPGSTGPDGLQRMIPIDAPDPHQEAQQVKRQRDKPRRRYKGRRAGMRRNRRSHRRNRIRVRVHHIKVRPRIRATDEHQGREDSVQLSRLEREILKELGITVQGHHAGRVRDDIILG